VGDRICQLVIMPVPAVEFVEAEELTETERGAGGYGSTGK
jgi:dUTP pyrophosphatase